MSAVAPEEPTMFGSRPRRPALRDNGDISPASGREASFSELVSTALVQVGALLRSEIALVRTELAAKATEAVTGAAMIAVAAVFGLSTVTLLLVTVAAVLVALGVPVALAMLIATLCGAVATGFLGWLGWQRLSADALKPHRSIAQIHNDAAMLKEQVR